MKTIFISVQTGMVVRDLLRCGPLQRILEHPDAHVVLLTPGVRDPAFGAEFGSERVTIAPQQPYAPSTMVWRLMTRRWKHARFAGMADAMHRLEEHFIPTPAAYERLLREYQPELVVSGDPLRPGDANLIAAARRHGVPSLGSVRSWDNLLKHLRSRPDALTVWNAINAREAVEVDRYRAEQVTQVGAPQLDVYFANGTTHRFGRADDGTNYDNDLGRPAQRDNSLGRPPHRDNSLGRPPIRPSSMAERLGFDPHKKTLLLATSSFTYESDQTYLVDMLLEAIRNGDIRQPLQIVLRLHPDDRVGRYLKYRHAPEVILDIPETYLATLGWTMTCADLEHTRALLVHADVMVNFATTLTLEAAITDTPSLLVAFSTIDPDEMQRYVVGLHFRMHYKALVERDLVPIAWDRNQLVSWINRYLEDASLYRQQRASIVREWVQFTDGQSGHRLGDAILRHAGMAVPETIQHVSPRAEEQCVS